MFGDKEAYLDKFCTAVRTRAPEDHILGPEFYCKEPSKPLFNKQKVFVLEHLYHYHVLIDLFKIMKEHSPQPIYTECFTASARKPSLLIVPAQNFAYTYNASKMWNSFRATEVGKENMDFSGSVPSFKRGLKSHLWSRQVLGDRAVWGYENFELV